MIRIRLKVMGRTHKHVYRIVAVDSRKQRDGRELEKLGHYDPSKDESIATLNADRFKYWVSVGAQVSDRVKSVVRMINKNEKTDIRY